MSRVIGPMFLALLVCSHAGPAIHAAQYYVDFAEGSDGNDGLSPQTAWKRAPGDPDATGNANRALSPGDVVLLKGGVFYRGSMWIPSTGSPGNPIVYKGDGWGTGKAIIDGSEPIAGAWFRCESAADCGGNANWNNIYYTFVDHPSFAESALSISLFHNDRPLVAAQEPPSTTPLYQTKTNYYTVLPSSVTGASLTDARLADVGGSDLVGSHVYLRVFPNEIVWREILSYDESSHTITFDDANVYTDRDTHYALANVINDTVFDAPGEFYLSPTPEADGSHKLYLWPLDNEDLSAGGDISLAIRSRGIDFRDHTIAEGFKIQKLIGTVFAEGRALGAAGTEGVIIRGNEIQLNKMISGAAIHCSSGRLASNLLIEDNYVHDTMGNARAIQANGNNIVFRGNLIVRCARTAMYFAGVFDGMIVNNTVLDSDGTHGNSLSVYQSSTNVLVAGNTVQNSTPATYENSDGVIFYNNFFGSGLKCWRNCTNTAIINNTFMADVGIFNSPGDYVTRNNILHDGGGGTRSHNIYTSLAWNQDEEHGWRPQEGEIIEFDLDRVFADAANGNYSLFENSVAVDAGTDISSLLPVARFPDYDFFKDIDGNLRPQGGAWDIGAFEASGEPDLEPPSIPQDLQASGISESAIVLNWSPSTDNVRVSKYNVFRDGAMIGSSPTPTYTDTGLQATTSYVYEVSAVDRIGNESARSAAVIGATLDPDLTAPSAPTNLNAEAIFAFSVTLSWDASSDNRGVTGYRVFRDGAEVGASVPPTFEDMGLAPNTTYRYTVTAHDAVGNESAPSAEAVITTLEPPPLGQGIEAAYGHDAGAGTVSPDASGNLHHGAIEGAQWTTEGYFGGALSFDGNDDYVDLGAWDVTGSELTVAAWINSASWDGGDPRIISKAIGVGEQDHYWMVSERNELLRFRLKTDGVTKTVVSDGVTLPIDTWVHVAVVYDGADMILYQDGVEVGRGDKTGPISTDPGVPINVGRNPFGAPNLFMGLLDEVYVFARALNRLEIMELMGRPVEDPAPTPTPTPSPSPTPPPPGPNIVTFENMEPRDDSNVLTEVFFSADITSSFGILSVCLWGNWSGQWQPETLMSFAPISGELLENPSFEVAEGAIAEDWFIHDDAQAWYATSVDEGYVGQAQRIDVFDVDQSGLSFFQTPSMEPGKVHEWRFWYKTSDNNSIHAEITDSGGNETDHHEQLPGTDGIWQSVNIIWAYDNELANELRITINEPGSVWLDEFSLKSYDAGAYPSEVSPEFILDLEPGVYIWALEVSNVQGSVFSRRRKLNVFGGSPNSVDRAWTLYR